MAETTAATPSEELVQVPAQLLKSLLESVESLQKEVADLREDVRISKHQSDHPRFKRFSEFPLEIRQLIWTFALTAPQIHIIGEEMISTSRVNVVMQACREARETGLSLEFEYYEVSKISENRNSQFGAKTSHMHSRRNYVNWPVDTLLLAEHDSIPTNINFFCNHCWELGCRQSLCNDTKKHKCGRKVQLGAVAINCNKWEDRKAKGGSWYEGFMIALWWYGMPQEVFFVVNGSDLKTMGRNIVFVEPVSSPWVALSNVSLVGPGSEYWEDLAAERTKEMEAFKEVHVAKMKKDLEKGNTKGDLNEDAELNNLSSWVIPRVRYVEVRPANSDWMASTEIITG